VSDIQWLPRVVVVLAFSVALHAQDADRAIEQLAREGWQAARALAPIGAPRDRLGPVNRVLERLDALIVSLPARYADAAIRAGVSAAQEEREEMALFLAHARDLSNQMALTGATAQWPLPIDELEGELWFEVDRYAEALKAYQQATRVTGSPRAWLGLARIHVRLGDTAAACAAYRAIAAAKLGEPADTETAVFLLRCNK
jgi:tetratricopeptide (TPR) repeat protein